MDIKFLFYTFLCIVAFILLIRFGNKKSVLINGLKKAGIELDRKVLADIALNNAAEFTKLVETAKSAL